MAGRLLLLFIVLPLIETWLLIEVGQEIGALATIAAVIATAVGGSQLVRYQGMQAINDIRACQARGEPPAVPLLEGAALLVAGAFLVTPGFITDTLGFLMLVPPLRRQVARRLLSRMVVITPAGSPYSGDPRRGHDVIEGDFRREDRDRDPWNRPR